MSNIISIGSSAIRQIDGYYCLNDLHKASGGENKHQPYLFIRLDQTQALIQQINTSVDLENAGIPAIKTQRGKFGGTYACKELVIAYAAWISPSFHLKVIRVFLAATDPVRTEKPKSGKYYYPKTMLNQRYFNGGTNSVRLYGVEVAHPKFISPTLDLFNRIESEGGTVDACRKEFDSMRKIIKEYTDFMESLQNQMTMVRTARY